MESKIISYKIQCGSCNKVVELNSTEIYIYPVQTEYIQLDFICPKCNKKDTITGIES